MVIEPTVDEIMAESVAARTLLESEVVSKWKKAPTLMRSGEEILLLKLLRWPVVKDQIIMRLDGRYVSP